MRYTVWFTMLRTRKEDKLKVYAKVSFSVISTVMLFSSDKSPNTY